MPVALFLLPAVGLISLAYACVLERLHDAYTPDLVWLTVVIGVAMLGLSLAAWLKIEPLSQADPLEAFWRFFAICVVAGGPIIAWQLGQSRARRLVRATTGGIR